MQHQDDSLAVSDFRTIIERLCLSATADFVAARTRLERLRAEGPPDDRDAE